MKGRLFLSMLLVFLFITPVFARGMFSENWDPPQVRLIYPTGDEVSLSGQDSLEFKWSKFDGSIIYRDYYDFRLYKGCATLEDNLILKQRIDYDEYSIKVKADLFQDGEVYTWTLRQVYRADGKSDRSYSTFKIIRK